MGKYIATSPNIEKEIFALCKDLSEENKIWLLRQIHRERCAFENKSWWIDNLTQDERDELVKIYTEFYPNIFISTFTTATFFLRIFAKSA